MTRTIDHVETLRSSEKFRKWRQFDLTHLLMAEAIDKHFKPEELAKAWGVSTETIRSIFREEPGVLKIGKTGAKYKRSYVTLRIPLEIAERVHKRLSA
jgi:hypothetical protein